MCNFWVLKTHKIVGVFSYLFCSLGPSFVGQVEFESLVAICLPSKAIDMHQSSNLCLDS